LQSITINSALKIRLNLNIMRMEEIINETNLSHLQTFEGMAIFYEQSLHMCRL